MPIDANALSKKEQPLKPEETGKSRQEVKWLTSLTYPTKTNNTFGNDVFPEEE